MLFGTPRCLTESAEDQTKEHLALTAGNSICAPEPQHSTLDDYPQEFPRVREDLVGRPYRFGYSAGLGSGIAQDTLCRIDMHSGSVTRRTDNDEMGYGEPVFILRENSTAEDDGYVMALRHNRRAICLTSVSSTPHRLPMTLSP